MFQIDGIEDVKAFETEEDAVEQAIRDGVKVIPIEELPEGFDRRYLGWIDTPDNRDAIAKYTDNTAVKEKAAVLLRRSTKPVQEIMKTGFL